MSRITNIVASLRHRNVFTLIELLVVISIISLLISILLPALSSARKAAQGVKCGNNFHQMMLGQAAYQQDYGWFVTPRVRYNSALHPHNEHWWQYALRPYVGLDSRLATGWDDAGKMSQEGVLLCPSMEIIGRDVRSYAMANFGHTIGNPYWGLTPFKQWDSDANTLTVRDDSIATAKIKILQSDILFMSELGHTPGDDYTHFSIRSGDYWTGKAADTTADFRHNDAKNVLFLDGHVGGFRNDNTINWQLFKGELP